MTEENVFSLSTETLRWIFFGWYFLNCLTFALTVYGLGFRTEVKSTRRILFIKFGAMLTLSMGLFTIFRAESFQDARLFTGVAALTISTSLFWWTFYVNRKKPLTLAYAPDQPRHIQRKGPYSVIRHPYYTSYLMSYLGAALLTWHVGMILCTVAMAWIYYQASAYEEHKFLISNFSRQYRAYMNATDRFLPLFAPFRKLAAGARAGRRI